MKQTLLIFVYLLFTFTSCDKKDDPKPIDTTYQVYISDKQAWISVNGLDQANNGQTIILSKGDKIEVTSNGEDSWNPITGFKTEGQVHTDIYINGKLAYSNHCFCDSYFTKTF